MMIHAAGAAVLRDTADGREVAVVHRDRYDDWTLPKGKLDGAELPAEAAVREVAEETGLTIRLGVPLGRIDYPLAGGDTKVVDYWVGEVLAEEHRPPDAEITAVQWIPVDQAAERLTYDHDQLVLGRALEQPPTTALMVLRHAKAVKRDEWDDPNDELRPLRPRGVRQADRLVPILQAYGIGDVVSSSATRCVQTVQPYATSTQLSVDLRDALTEPAVAADPSDHDATLDELRDRATSSGVPMVVCGHRPALPRTLEHLGIVARPMRTAEAAVAHLSADGDLVAVEWVHADQQ